MVRFLRVAGSVVVVLVVAAGVVLFLTGRLRIDPTGKFEPKPGGEAKGGHEGHDEHEEGKSHVVDGKIVLDGESLAASGVKTAPAEVGSIAVTLPVTGEVEIASDRVAHVTPRIAGSLVRIERAVGDEVQAGATLATIQSVELGEARAAHVSADSELALTERNFGRWRELFEKGLRTQNELWVAESDFTRARIRHEAATNKLKAMGVDDQEIAALDSRTLSNRYELASPIGGTVLERHATLGENVEGKDVLFLVADLSLVWVQAAVYEKDIALIREGMTATVRTQAYPDVRFPGTVTYLGEKVDEKTRTLPIRVAVNNGPRPGSDRGHALRPGMFTTVELEIHRRESVVVVPAAAVQSMGAQSVVFVRVAAPAPASHDGHDHGKEPKGKPDDHDGHDHGKEPKGKPDDHDGHDHGKEPKGKGDEPKGKHDEHDGHDHGKEPKGKPDEHGHAAGGAAAFEKRVVTVGERDRDLVEILSGLKVGDEVVVENAYLLKSELEKSSISEGHSH